MTRKTRLIILSLFAAAFVLTTPVVILTTSGYRYNWNKGKLDKTGIIKFVTKPSGARVWLNGHLQTRTTPMSMFRLLPEDYEIRMEMPGYHEWKKILEVKSGTTTFTEDVVLIRRTSPRPVKNMSWKSGVWSNNGLHFAMVRTGVGTDELVVMESQGTNEVLLARLAPQRYSQIEMKWSPDDHRLMFLGELAENPNQVEITIYPLPPMEVAPIILTSVANGRKAIPASWSTGGGLVTFMAEKAVNLIDISEGSSGLIPGTAGADDALHANGQLLITKRDSNGAHLLRVSPKADRAPELLADLPPEQWHFSMSEGDYLLLSNRRQTQAIIYRISDSKIFGPWSGSKGQWENPDGQGRLLLCNDFEISIWNPKNNGRSVVTRLSSPINQCIWDPTGRNVIFTAGNSILVAEIDDRDGRNIYELNRMTKIGAINVDGADRQILFLGTAGNQEALFQQGF